MSEVTNGTEYVENDKAVIEIGGTLVPAYIDGEIEYTYTYYPAEGMSGRMEDAIPSSDEITLDSVDLIVTIYGVEDLDALTAKQGQVQFRTTSIDFYEKHFGVLHSMDVSL